MRSNRSSPTSLIGLALLAGLASSGCKMSPGTGEAGAEPLAEIEVGRVMIGGILWYVDYDDAVEIARAQDKALWVHFGENPG